MSRMLVTGGSGFIGTNLVEALRSGGAEVINFDCRPPLDSSHAELHWAGDILDLPQVERVFHEFQPDYVIHLAARTDLLGTTLEDYAANTTGVENIIEAIRRQRTVQRAIFASSRYVHATERQPASDVDYSPFTAYGQSKAAGEQIVRGSKLEIPWLLIRPTSIWGPWFDVPYKGFFAAVQRGLYVHPRGEKLYKSYGFVGNIVHEILAFLDAPQHLIQGKTFYVADYQPLEVREFAELVRESFDASPVREVPVTVMRALALGGDAMKKCGMRNPPLTSFRLNNLRAQMIYDMSATESVVGPLPYSLGKGVEITVAWMKETGAES